MHQNGFLFATKCNSLDTGLIDQLKEILNKNTNIKLIIIDTLQLVRGQVNKNDTLYGHDYKEISKLKKFADNNHICVMIIHHFRKIPDMADTFNQISGTSGITGASDTMITLSKEARFENKTILSLTGRDIDEGEYILAVDKETHKFNIIGNQEDLKELDNINIYRSNPIIITINELLEENENSLSITSKGLYDEIFFRRKIRIKEKSAAALTRTIGSKLQYDMLKYDNIHYEPPNQNGGACGREMYFCKISE